MSDPSVPPQERLELPPGSESVAPAPSTSPSEQPLAYRVVRGGLWVAASSYFNIGFGFLASLVLTRILSPEDFGVFALAWFFGGLIDLRTWSGIGSAFAQRRATSGDLIGTHITLDVTAGVLGVILAGFAVPLLRFFGYSWDVILVVVALAGIGLIGSTLVTAWVLLDKELHFSQTSLVLGLFFPVSYIPAFWLALHGGRYWSLVAQTATFTAFQLIGMWWLAWRRLPGTFQLHWRFNREVATQLVRFGLPVGLATFAGLLVTRFDNFLVGTFVGEVTLGFYDRAYRIAQWPTLLVTSIISRTAFYTYVRLQDDSVRLRKSVTMSLWLITTLALPLAVAIFAAAPDLVAWLYGERWMDSAIFLRFLVAYSVIRPLLDDAGSLFVAVGRPRLNVAVTVAEAATLIGAGTVLTIAFGAIGTAVAVGVTFVVGLAMTYRYVGRVVALNWRESLGTPMLVTVLTLLLYLLLARTFDLNVLPVAVRALLKVAFTGITYFAILLVLKPHGTVDRARYVWRLMRGGSSLAPE